MMMSVPSLPGVPPLLSGHRHGGRVERSLMAGNSIRSDVLPMIHAGGYGVYVPFSILWDHEHEEVPKETERFFAVDDMRGVVDVAARLT